MISVLTNDANCIIILHMRMTVELDEKTLDELLKVTGHTKEQSGRGVRRAGFSQPEKSTGLWPDVAGRQIRLSRHERTKLKPRDV